MTQKSRQTDEQTLSGERGIRKQLKDLRDWIRKPKVFIFGVKGAVGDDHEPLFQANLTDQAKAVAKGFGVLTALLAFFSVKDGILDRLLRINSTAALWVFILVGCGVACGIAAPAFSSNVSMLLWAPFSACIAAGVVSWWLLPDLNANNALSVIAVLAVLGAVVVLVSRADAKLPVQAGVMLLGLVLLGMGLYGAAKLSVQTKSYTTSPNVTVSSTEVDGSRSLDVAIRATGRDGMLPLRLEIRGGDKHVVVAAATLAVDEAGTIAANQKFSVDPSRFAGYEVIYCDVAKGVPPEEACGKSSTQAFTFAGTAVQTRVSGSLQAGAKGGSLSVVTEVQGATPGTSVIMKVSRCRSGRCAVITTTTVGINGKGAGTTSITVFGATSRDIFTLSCVVDGKPKQIATYVVA